MAQETKTIELSDRVYIIAIILVGAIAISYLAGVVINMLNLPVFYPKEITITGQGKVVVVPDIATVQFGVTNEGDDIASVTQKNTDQMNGVIKLIKEAGVEEKDIKTTQYSLTPRYEYTDKGERAFKGYTMTQQVMVKIRDFKKIGAILNAGTQNGATLVQDLTFTIDDQEKIKQQARLEAIEEAREKATAIAKASGLRLGRVLNVQESYYPYYYGAGAASMEKAIDSSVPVPEIQPGQQEVTVSVYITYRIR